MVIKNFKILLMGDASIEVEKEIIKDYSLSDISILKIGHHGSSTSTCEELLNETKPLYAVISAGKNNKYNFPKVSVINLLNKSKINIVSTINKNTIIFQINNDLQLKS